MPLTAKPAQSSARHNPDEKLTLAEVCAELRIERSTFYDWRAKGRAPRCSKLPNGELRIVRRDLDIRFEGLQAHTAHGGEHTRTRAGRGAARRAGAR